MHFATINPIDPLFLTMLQGRTLQIAQLALIVAPAFILFGYNQAGLGPLATLQSWVKIFPQIDTINVSEEDEPRNSTRQGAVIASFQIGALIGALSCAFLSDWIGRCKTIFIAAILSIIGQVLQTSSYGIIQFVIGRVVLGISIGQFNVAVPVWQSECSAARTRGQHVIIDGIFICFGYTLCNWIDFGLSKTEGTIQWRIPLAISFIWSLMIVSFIFTFPESPRWLARVGCVEDAKASLAQYRGVSVDDEMIQMEIAGIESSLEMTKHSASLKEIFSKNNEQRLLYRFCLCIALQFFQQMCGGNLISVYASTIFEENLSMNADLARILSSCALTWKFLCSFLAFVTIDRFGRRRVFIASGTGMCICMAAMAITNSFGSTNHKASIASAVFIFLFNSFYPVGFSGGNILYCTEVAPVQLRVAMSSVSTANHWLWNFIVVMITPVALRTIGYQYYIMYAVISACIPIAVYFFYPETMNRNLEALNHVFRDAPSAWQIVSMARYLPQGEATEVAMLEQDKEKEKWPYGTKQKQEQYC